jgi:starch phosphorylase
MGFSPDWIRMAKQSIGTLLPRFNARRMVSEYVDKFYRRAARQGQRYRRDGLAVAGAVAEFKRRVRKAWPDLSMRRLDTAVPRIAFGEQLIAEVGVNLAGLDPHEVRVELVLERLDGRSGDEERRCYALAPVADSPHGVERRYRIELAPELCGHLCYRLRAYPAHPDFTHPFEMGLMRWA